MRATGDHIGKKNTLKITTDEYLEMIAKDVNTANLLMQGIRRDLSVRDERNRVLAYLSFAFSSAAFLIALAAFVVLLVK